MLELIFRRQVWVVVLASGFGAACNDQTAATLTALPAPCSAAPLPDGGRAPGLLSPAHGSVTGSDVVARLCDGGASAYLQRTTPTTSPPDQLLMYISSYTVDPTRDFQIALPTDATRLELSVIIGPGAAQPGTYTEGSVCGDITLCAIMPVPTSAYCPPIQIDICPPGCTFSGSSSCVPIEPAICYQAITNPTCWGGSASGQGSWRLTLSSVELYTVPAGGSSNGEAFVTHGSLDATLVKIIDGAGDVDAGATRTNTASLSLSF